MIGIMNSTVILTAKTMWQSFTALPYPFAAKAAKLLNELEFDAGLIRRKHQGQGRPNRIYPKVLEVSYTQAV